jgi:uncharacterized membrane protein YesL
MAGFFGFFDYSKPGKGVRKDEPQRSHFSRFFILYGRKFSKMIQLNLLFLLSCAPLLAVAYVVVSQPPEVGQSIFFLPVSLVASLPMGPAIAGVTMIMRRFENEEPVFLLSDFWDTVKANWKQAVIYQLILMLATFIMMTSGNFYWQGAAEQQWMYVPAIIIAIIGITFVFANYYIYIMIVTLELPLRAIIKNGFIMAILGLKSNFFTTVWLGLIIFFTWLMPVLGFLLFVVLGFSLVGFIVVHNSFRVVKKYAIDPFMARQEGGDEPEEEDKRIFSDELLDPQKDR